MIQLLMMCAFSAWQPSNPPPQPPPEKIIAVIFEADERKEQKLEGSSEKVKPSLNNHQHEKVVRKNHSKRRYKRRGTRNH